MSGANLELGDGDKEGDANANGDAVKAKLIKPKRNICVNHWSTISWFCSGSDETSSFF